jgi:F-type H+-transporting ATPase subunit epsilon
VINTKVVSQTNKIFEGEALSIAVPTQEGVLTIFPDHADLVALLDIGNLVIRGTQGETKILVNSGLLQIKKNDITILSDEAVLPENIMLTEIETAITNAKEQLAAPIDATELVQLEKQLRFELFKKSFIEAH